MIPRDVNLQAVWRLAALPTLSDISCHVILEALQRRNGPVEVLGIPSDGDERGAAWYRVRLLEFSPAGLVIERPQISEESRYIQPDSFVRVSVADGLERWQFLAHVEKVILHPLNATTRVPALKLSAPMEIRTGQRREFFRVLTAAAGLRPVLLTPLPAQPEVQPAISTGGSSPSSDTLPFPGPPTPPAQPAPAPLNFPPQPFRASLLNIAGGGLGAEAPLRLASQICLVTFYRCRLELPTCPDPLELGASVKHIDLMDNGAYYLGLSFECLNAVEHRQCIDAICRFSAWFQRRQLQRLREKM